MESLRGGGRSVMKVGGVTSSLAEGLGDKRAGGTGQLTIKWAQLTCVCRPRQRSWRGFRFAKTLPAAARQQSGGQRSI